MKSTLVSRLKRLEARMAAKQASLVRFGVLKELPSDYVGDRRIVVISRAVDSMSSIEWCQCEERPGQAPLGSDNSVPTIYFSEDEMNL